MEETVTESVTPNTGKATHPHYRSKVKLWSLVTKVGASRCIAGFVFFGRCTSNSDNESYEFGLLDSSSENEEGQESSEVVAYSGESQLA